MKKGQRSEKTLPFYKRIWQKFTGLSIWQAVFRFAKKHKKMVITAGCLFAAMSLIVVFAFVFGGLPEEPEVSPSPPASARPSPLPIPSPEPSPSPTDYTLNPLTGLPLKNADTFHNRPIAVLHNNSYGSAGSRQNALPMYGIGQADIIYEMIAEGRTTRMLALYQEFADIPKIGAVRSARLYFCELALAYDAILVHAGGTSEVLPWGAGPGCIAEWGMNTINSLNQSSKYFWRDSSDRPNAALEHTLFTSGERLFELYERIARQDVLETIAENSLKFSRDAEVTGSGAATVKVTVFSNKTTMFYYNGEDNLYYVEQYGNPFVDGLTGEQVAVTNLFVLQTSIRPTPGDPPYNTIDLQSGGTGYYAAGGAVIPITWTRESHDAPFFYFDADGNPLILSPGKSYVCIIPAALEPEFE
jgi:hypothetical protein